MCLPPTGRSERGGLVRAAGVAGLLCLLAACEVAAPEAHELFWKRVMFADLRQGRTYETLTLFARVSDADGLDDLDALYVMNDDAQLFWRLTPEVWVVDRSDSGTWIGSTALAMPSDEPLPAGVYRVIVQDIAGQTAEESFRVTGSTGPEARWHAEAIDVAIDANELTVTGPFASYEVWLYGSAGTRVAAAAFAERIDLESALPEGTLADELLLYVYAEPPDDGSGYLSGPYAWKRN
ncbi:MAG: hypothetical protein OXQ31_13750 [Spirochaetaceae bacterium]|nr:hypothetical protein [Spirochaetaceae bacterium]